MSTCTTTASNLVMPNTPPSSTAADSPQHPPPTPVSPPALTPLDTNAANAPRRKPSRRANTAERRATHNAVERQRRETLNGRFLDLAALLPNLASVRRPSKSSIVNSSIALIHAQRRARATAARELRALNAEADALRRELNEWRERTRSGLGRIEEPPRSVEFVALINLQEEEEEGEDERRAYAAMRDDMGDGDDMDEEDLPEVIAVQQPSPLGHHPRMHSHPGPFPSVSPHTQYDAGLPFIDHANAAADKYASWNTQLYSAIAVQQQQSQWAHQQAAAQAALFTPPSSAHGAGNMPFGAPNSQTQTYIANGSPTSSHSSAGSPAYTFAPEAPLAAAFRGGFPRQAASASAGPTAGGGHFAAAMGLFI